MRVLIVGLGNQGRKRQAIAGDEVVGTVDPVAPVAPVAPGASYRSVDEVPLDRYDAALVCTGDQVKPGILRHLLSNGKHVLVEKPLLGTEEELREFGRLSRERGAVCYTAYNHRFEPHIARVKEVLEAGVLGQVYSARFFYGNGTALDVRSSGWRDEGMGVLSDLGSHLLDMVLFLFGRPDAEFRLWSGNRFENRAYDHVLFGANGRPALQLEMTLLSWRNTFHLDILAERGTAHIDCLCKWGPSTFTLRTRVYPSGRPTEEQVVLVQPDPTWAAEYAHFKDLCGRGGTNVENDLWIQASLASLAAQGS